MNLEILTVLVTRHMAEDKNKMIPKLEEKISGEVISIFLDDTEADSKHLIWMQKGTR